MKKVTLKVSNTSFSVTINKEDEDLYFALKQIKTYSVTYKDVFNPKFKRHVRVIDKFYFCKNKNNEYKLPIKVFPNFIQSLKSKGYKKSDFELIDERNVPYRKIKYKWNKKLKPFNYQLEANKIFTKTNHTNILLDILMGYGKTLTSLYTMYTMQRFFGILIRPNYIPKWILDVKKHLLLKDEEIYVVQGGDSLRAIMEDPSILDTKKCIIFSLRTISNYITEYENEEIFTYDITPDRLMQHLGVSVVINDEAHQEFHAVLKANLYFNVYRWIGLSATLRSNDARMRTIYRLMYDDSNMISNLIEYVNYLIVIATRYHVKLTRFIRYQRTQGYNHMLLEESILRSNLYIRGYLQLIKNRIEKRFVPRYKKGRKMLVYAATIRMCTIISNFLRTEFQDYNVQRYVDDDPFDNILTGEITVTTVLNAGTGLDIPGLNYILQTVSIGSMQANLQTAGRLREIPGEDVIFEYIYAHEIPPQRNLHRLRLQSLKEIAKSIRHEEYDETLRS